MAEYPPFKRSYDSPILSTFTNMKKKLKIVCIADLQGMCDRIYPSLLPKGDMLIIAGDLTARGGIEPLKEVNNWLGTLEYKYKIVVAGNHDLGLNGDIDGHEIFTNAIYLQDELVEIEGLKIYGSPVNEMNELKYNGWVFCYPDYIREVVKKFPQGLDILITHGPPLGILDKLARDFRHVGSPDILETVRDIKPKYHIFGHIHESAGKMKKGKITFINAAICDQRNTLFRDENHLFFDPIVITI